MPHRRSPRLLIALAASLWALVPSSVAAAQDVPPIVYVRCKRYEVRPFTIRATITLDDRPQEVERTIRYGTESGDILPDVRRFLSDFNAPCDLLYRASDGSERILYECPEGEAGEASCAAMDPAVSYDGTRVVFSVFRGTLRAVRRRVTARSLHPRGDPSERLYVTFPTLRLESTDAQLHVVDIASGEVRPLPHAPDTYDSGPVWLPDGRIAFTSTRGDYFATKVASVTANAPATRLMAVDANGDNLEVLTHHELGQVQHPLILTDGRIAYSSWQLFGLLPYRTDNGLPGNFGTLHNFFHLFTVRSDGSEPFALFGQHLVNRPSRLRMEGPRRSEPLPPHLAAHFIGQSSDGRIWVADYYRSNNLGFGHIVGFPPPEHGQEGLPPEEVPGNGDFYRPRDFVVLAPWARNRDAPSRTALELDEEIRVPQYGARLAFLGKLSHPAGAPGNRLLVSWCKGHCSHIGPKLDVHSGRELMRRVFGLEVPLDPREGPCCDAFEPGPAGVLAAIYEHLDWDNPYYDAGIYLTSRIPSRSPSDLLMVVDSRQWHEIMPRTALPYREVYGIDAPPVTRRDALPERGAQWVQGAEPFGILGASSILYRETRPVEGYPFTSKDAWALQGADLFRYEDDEICGIRILAVHPSVQKGPPRGWAVPYGERVSILGEFPVRHYDEAGRPRMAPWDEPDTSFLVRFPADVPYLMQAVDCDGRALYTDQSWQQLRPGETKVCGGCHVHAKPGRPLEGVTALRPGYEPWRLGEGRVPLLTGGRGPDVRLQWEEGSYGVTYEFERDVFPILQSKCASPACHAASEPAAGLALDGDPSEVYRCLVTDRRQSCVPEERRRPSGILAKPQLTRYVRALTARGSLLYWKAAGQRTDGLEDDEREGDIDFGESHPAALTPEELGVLARWIEVGAGYGEPYRRDTIPPTLVVVLQAPEDAGEATTLLVGTADVTSGIDPDSLRVCWRPAPRQEPCTPLEAPPAAPAAAVPVQLPPEVRSDDTEIEVRVRDREGNETVVHRTMAFLRSGPAALPPAPPAASSDGGRALDPGAGGESSSSGCACATRPEPHPRDLASWVWTAGLIAAVLARRRRRRRGGSP